MCGYHAACDSMLCADHKLILEIRSVGFDIRLINLKVNAAFVLLVDLETACLVVL